jgi:quinol monooxygenase YgiN
MQEAGGMYARSTTIDGKPEWLEKGIAYVRDRVMPAVSAMDGYIGISMLADRMSGRCIVTTSWADAEALRRSAPEVRGMRARATDILQGPAELQEWQIAVVHRRRPAGDGACTRVLWTTGDAAAMDQTLDAFRVGMLHRIEELPGFCSVSLMADRPSGRCALAVTYADRAAMDRAQEEALVIRQQFTRKTAQAVTDVQAFDLVLAHLRVPETV